MSEQKKKITVKKPVQVVKKSTVAAKKSEAPKTIVKKDVPVKDTSNDVEPADSPENIKVAGWKTKLAEKKAALMPKVLKPKSETWDKRKVEKQEGKKRLKGLVVIIDGLRKTGKSHISDTAADFEGFEGKKRIIPKGYPVYILDTENAAEDEVDFNFGDQKDAGKILVENVVEKDEFTKEIDPVKSMNHLEEWAYSLENETEGTLVIDNFTDYCKWANWKLEELKQIDHEKSTLAMKGVAKLSRYDYGWLYKRVDTFLRTLRQMKMNIILIAKVKDEWVNPNPADPYAGYKTGGYLTEATKGFDYWVDVICRFEKEKFEDHVVRRLIVTDSRFETVDMKNRNYILEGNPTFSGLIDLFKDLL